MKRNHLNKPRKDWSEIFDELEKYCSVEFYMRVSELMYSKEERYDKCVVALYQLIDIIESNNDCEYNVNKVKNSAWVFDEIEILEKEVMESIKQIGHEISIYKESAYNDIAYCLFLININQFERENLENKFYSLDNSLIKVVNDIASDVSTTFTAVEDLREHLLNICNSKDSEEKIKQLNETRENIRYKYMKRNDILKMLKENNFSEVKSGRHRNFENEDGKKIPVPFHGNKDIGKGLSIKIQKEIFE